MSFLRSRTALFVGAACFAAGALAGTFVFAKAALVWRGYELAKSGGDELKFARSVALAIAMAREAGGDAKDACRSLNAPPPSTWLIAVGSERCGAEAGTAALSPDWQDWMKENGVVGLVNSGPEVFVVFGDLTIARATSPRRFVPTHQCTLPSTCRAIEGPEIPLDHAPPTLTLAD